MSFVCLKHKTSSFSLHPEHQNGLIELLGVLQQRNPPSETPAACHTTIMFHFFNQFNDVCPEQEMSLKM